MAIVDLEATYSGVKLQNRLERKKRQWNRSIKSKVGRHVKKLLQTQYENDEGLNYRSCNETEEKRINWTGNSGINKCGERGQRDQKVTKDFLQTTINCQVNCAT